MLILALDSATARISLALWRDGVVLAAGSAEAGRTDALPDAVAALVARAGLGLPALDRLAVTIGPGRFTGLRAGLAFMRGLALALDRPLIGMTTLDALAAAGAAEADEVPVAVIDSRRAELFFQIADGPAFACLPEALAGRLPTAGAVVVVGEEAARVAAALRAAGRAARAVPETVAAATVARLAAVRPVPPAAPPPSPLYIHPPATTAPRRAGPA
jgi:tRNA threonylcarbamoyladenosine biosynthesis protein TsaB